MSLFDIFKTSKKPSITSVSGCRSIHGIKNLSKQTMYSLQAMAIPGSKKGTITAEKIIFVCDGIISQALNIIDDCKKLISTTENPKTFYERYDLLIKKYKELEKYEYYIEIYGYQPSESIKYFTEIKVNYEKKLIDRCYNKALIKADSLKTDKGKKNQFIKTYNMLKEYENQMLQSNAMYLNNKFEKKVD